MSITHADRYTGQGEDRWSRTVLKWTGNRSEPLPRHPDRRTGDMYNWGYRGQGPTDLAWSLLADVLGSNIIPGQLAAEFKSEKIATIRSATWEMSREEILAWIRTKERSGE